MSTKQTILYRTDEKTDAGFHLYQDLLELDEDGNCPVHLELNAVRFEAGAGWIAGGGGVDVTIPRAWAEELGLVMPNPDVTGIAPVGVSVSRLRAHAEAHEYIANADAEQRQWMKDLHDAADEIEKLRGEKLRLEIAIQRTLDENGHLADGDDCTLRHLVRAAGV